MTTMTKARDLSPESPVDRVSSEVLGQEPSTEEIAQRAYERFEARGRETGSDLDDWLEAERELRAGNGHDRS